jgi:hypothetical protein
MSDPEIIELLGGGKAGVKRFAKLRTRAKHQVIFGRCRHCSRLFVNHRCWWIVTGEFCPAGFDGLKGRIEANVVACLECEPMPPPGRSHSTP